MYIRRYKIYNFFLFFSKLFYSYFLRQDLWLTPKVANFSILPSQLALRSFCAHLPRPLIKSVQPYLLNISVRSGDLIAGHWKCIISVISTEPSPKPPPSISWLNGKGFELFFSSFWALFSIWSSWEYLSQQHLCLVHWSLLTSGVQIAEHWKFVLLIYILAISIFKI